MYIHIEMETVICTACTVIMYIHIEMETVFSSLCGCLLSEDGVSVDAVLYEQGDLPHSLGIPFVFSG